MRFEAPADLRRLDGGRVALGGSPMRFLRLSEKGGSLLDRLSSGDEVELGSGELAFAHRMADKGMLVPRPALGAGPFRASDVTIVVPVVDRVDELGACLRAIDKAGAQAEVVVVDDGSADPAAIALVAGRHGARLVRLEANGGPASARNRGLDEVTTPLVAFVDSDVEVGDDWLAWLVRFFADDAVALVAPRVLAPSGARRPSPWARYESSRSSLDLGPRPGPIRAGSRIGYVPAAAIVCRAEAVRAIGGFDETMRVGEDVDLVWRLAEAGWRAWYVGDGAWVSHALRPDVVGALRQRVGYGSSSAPLDARHPGSVAPLVVSRWSVGVWAALASGHPLAAAAVAGGNAIAMGRKLDFLDHPRREGARLVARGHLGAGELIARAMLRPWFPLTLVASSVSRRARRIAVVAAIAPPLVEWVRRRPPLDPASWVACSLADDIAYSVGVWAGCWRARSLRPLLPRLGS